MLPYNQAMISFDDAVDFLRLRRSPTFDDLQHGLTDIKLLAQVYLAYQRLFPKNYRNKLLGKVPQAVKELKHDPDFTIKLVNVIGSLFPVNEDVMDEEPEYIYIEQQGLSMTWDELDELLSGNGMYEFYDLQNYAFPVLCWSVGNGIGQEMWDDLSELLEWNVPYPERLLSDDVYVDTYVLRKELNKRGLADFFASLQLAWRFSGNYFIDFDPETHSEYPTFTAENICDLVKKWRKAKVILDADVRAMKRLQTDNSLFKTFIECLEMAAKERKSK